MEVDEERFRLEQEAEDLINDDPENERLHQVYERLDDLDADKAEAKAARILKGLGFNKGKENLQLKWLSKGNSLRILAFDMV